MDPPKKPEIIGIKDLSDPIPPVVKPDPVVPVEPKRPPTAPKALYSAPPAAAAVKTPEVRKAPPAPVKPKLDPVPIEPKRPASLPKALYSAPPAGPTLKRDAAKCSESCDGSRTQLVLARGDSCCGSKLVIPIEMGKLGQIGTDEIMEATAESNNVVLLQKLLTLAEKYKL